GTTEDPIQRRDQAAAHRALRLLVVHAGAQAREGRAEHGPRRREDRLQGPRPRDGPARGDRRAEAQHPRRAQVDRAVQGARGHAGRRGGDPAQRARLRVHRPPRLRGDPAHPRLPGAQAHVLRRARQLRHGRQGADDVPRGRLRRDRCGPRAGHHHHHLGSHRPGGLRPARGVRLPVLQGRQPLHPKDGGL
ncbi:MAG: LSU ribosomal protein L5p (L11e), partial [uncultured Solirubrobacteraceae bacterium]